MQRSLFARLFPMFAAFSLCAALARPAAACGPYVPETPEERASSAALRALAKLPAAARPILKSIWTDGEIAVARVESPKNKSAKLLVLRNVNGDFRLVQTVAAR